MTNKETVFGEVSTSNTQVQTGWNFPYNLNPLQVRIFTTGGGTVTHEGNMAVASVNGSAGDEAVVRTNGYIAYTPGIGAVARFTARFSEPEIGLTQIIGAGDEYDGWFFGYNGLDFGILFRAKGVDTWLVQDAWNIDRRSDLDPQQGNVYQIAFQWLGFGMQYFGIEDRTGSIKNVHHRGYANRNEETSVDIPAVPISMRITAATDGITASMRSPSAIALSQGEAFPIGFTIPNGHSRKITVSAGTTYFYTISNPDTYEGKPNKLYIDGALLTVANDTNKSITLYLYLNATLTGASFTDVLTGLAPAQVDEASTAISNGIEVISVTVEKESGVTVDLTSVLQRTRLWAGTQVSFVTEGTGIGDVDVAFTYRSRL